MKLVFKFPDISWALTIKFIVWHTSNSSGSFRSWLKYLKKHSCSSRINNFWSHELSVVFNIRNPQKRPYSSWGIMTRTETYRFVKEANETTTISKISKWSPFVVITRTGKHTHGRIEQVLRLRFLALCKAKNCRKTLLFTFTNTAP